jgi:hypothetical protein
MENIMDILDFKEFSEVYDLVKEETASADIATVDNKILDKPVKRKLYDFLKTKKSKCKKKKA